MTTKAAAEKKTVSKKQFKKNVKARFPKNHIVTENDGLLTIFDKATDQLGALDFRDKQVQKVFGCPSPAPKPKQPKESDEYTIIDGKKLEAITKRIRAKFPKSYTVEGFYKLGNVRIDNPDGEWVGELSFNESVMQDAFGK